MRRVSAILHVRSRHSHIASVTALCVVLLAVAQLVDAQTFSVLYSFQNTTDGSNPQVGLYLNGALYGTTLVGSNATCLCGSVYQYVPGGALTTLHSFVGTDGANPVGSLIADSSGNLYGTTSQGGAGNAGTVYKLSPPATQGGTWTLTVLYSFTDGADGGHPLAGVIRNSAGNLYGTTNSGGAFDDGTVFEVTVRGVESVLYSFKGSPDGAYPYAGLIEDSAGNFYGTTYSGGADGYGTVFKLNAQRQESVLHSFNGTTEGAYPSAMLTMDSSGDLYGAANQGGSEQQGTIFKISSAGKFSLVHTFTGRPKGANPASGVILSSAGILYGATTEGGDSDDDGTLFEVSPSTGTFTSLHTFASGNLGNYPYTGMVSDPSGNLYGATESGGTGRRGLIYELNFAGSAESREVH